MRPPIVLLLAVACAKAPAVAIPAAEESPMMVIRVIVDVTADQHDAFVATMHEEAAGVRQMAGCERYDLFEDTSRANRFLLYEEWATPAAFDAYRTSDAFQERFAVLKPMMAGPPSSAYYDATQTGPGQ